MNVEVVAVHPTTIVVKAEDRQFEIPASAFAQAPKPHQHWTLTLDHQPTEAERLDQLNRYLRRD